MYMNGLYSRIDRCLKVAPCATLLKPFKNQSLRKNMLLIIVFALMDFGSSSHTTVEWCYGGHYKAPYSFTPPLFKDPIYFKPRGEERILVFSEGKARHERFSVVYGRITMKDLTEQDNEGVLLFGRVGSVKLIIEDCQDPQSSQYGDLFSWKVPSGAEYLEFSMIGSSGFAEKPQVIWNRTDASSGRGAVKRNYYELQNLKQKDSGYYKFMSAGGQRIKWKRLEVKEHSRNPDPYIDGENLKTYFPVMFPSLRRILFTPKESGYEQTIDKKYIDDRMELTDSYFSIRDLKHEDAGTYKFVDDEGFLAMRMEVYVMYPEVPVWVFVVGLVIIVICLVCCCCCVKKCCCKKSSNKRNGPENEAAAPRVFYHDTTQPTQPVIPLLSREPRLINADPPTNNSALRRIDLPTSTQQVTVPEGPGHTSTSLTLTSSDSDPRFEFKGAVFPSAPPLSSGTSIQDVYTSDKLNFL